MRPRVAAMVLGALAVLAPVSVRGGENPPSAEPPSKAKSKVSGEDILKDATLFREDFAAVFLRMWSARPVSLPSARPGEVGMEVAQAPTLVDIETKYGAARHREKRRSGNAGFGQVRPPLDVVVHWYGPIGFGVPKDDKAKNNDIPIGGRVVWVVATPKK